MGRPTLLTQPDIRDRFVQAVGAGVHPEVAARLVGISPATYYRYKRGTSADQVAFAQEVEQALARLEARLVATVVQAAYADPLIALKVLERRFSQRWRAGAASVEFDLDPRPQQSSGEERVIVDVKFIAEIVPRLLEAGRGPGADATDPALFEGEDERDEDDLGDEDVDPDDTEADADG